MDDDAAHRERMATLQTSALTLLVERAGGMVEFSEADYQKIVAKYGGPIRIHLRIEIVREARKDDRVRVTLRERTPRADVEMPEPLPDPD